MGPPPACQVKDLSIDLLEKTIYENGSESYASCAGIALCSASHIVESAITSGTRRMVYFCLDLGRDIAMAETLKDVRRVRPVRIPAETGATEVS